MAKLDPSGTADREMILSRLIDAPRTLVFDAYTDPKHVGAWWGPNGFTITTRVCDIRVGGMWCFMMHGPDGTDYPNRIVYTEITRPERITFDYGDDIDDDPNQFKVWVTFEDRDGKTQLTQKMVLSSAAVLQEIKKFGAEELGQQTLAKLEAYLATLQARP